MPWTVKDTSDEIVQNLGLKRLELLGGGEEWVSQGKGIPLAELLIDEKRRLAIFRLFPDFPSGWEDESKALKRLQEQTATPGIMVVSLTGNRMESAVKDTLCGSPLLEIAEKHFEEKEAEEEEIRRKDPSQIVCPKCGNDNSFQMLFAATAIVERRFIKGEEDRDLDGVEDLGRILSIKCWDCGFESEDTSIFERKNVKTARGG